MSSGTWVTHHVLLPLMGKFANRTVLTADSKLCCRGTHCTRRLRHWRGARDQHTGEGDELSRLFKRHTELQEPTQWHTDLSKVWQQAQNSEAAGSNSVLLGTEGEVKQRRRGGARIKMREVEVVALSKWCVIYTYSMLKHTCSHSTLHIMLF
ncbi:hypothetical protein EYF80_000889 [Liparis tanakae]|uniref:Uncharacterized protein n=1 Tax=Liparis tanakae TaxID=230148 RepID=A0A4Z2JGB4_9TELE|nr:hypothetical protein EYF80_000889 [Liparis tanakae]